MQKPANYIDWMTDTAEPDDAIVEPVAEKKLQGWLAAEKPPYNFFNWFWKRLGEWVRFFDKTHNQYDATIGAGADCTHATLALAVADAAVTVNSRILVRDNITVNTSAIALTKAGWIIHARPGVTITKGTSTTGLSVSAEGVELHGFRFAGFTVDGDKSIVYAAGGNYGRVVGCRFAAIAGTALEIDDTGVTAGKKPLTALNFSEV